MNAREVALLVVRDVFPSEPNVEARATQAALGYRAGRAKLDTRDRKFATELCYGAIKMRRALDAALAPFVKERATPLPATILELLRLAIYELRFTEPDVHATLFEWVNLAKRYGHQGLAGLVNAVLRSYLREPTPPPIRESFQSEDEYLGVLHSLPTWLVRRWRATFGDALLERLCSEANRPAAHAVVGLGSASVVMAEMERRGVHAEHSSLARDAVMVSMKEMLDVLDGASNPYWMQSESSALVVDLLDPQPGERIGDCCSGRGNKAMQIASRVGENGSVTCIDRDARKIAALQHRFAEFPQLLTPAFVLGDATDPALLPQTLTFDRVLVDAPCTALGVLARHPEARWWRKHDDAARLAPTQRALLEAMASHVAPGGRLLYAVCSNDEREGSEVVEAFLASSNFVRVPMPERLAAMCDAKGDVLIPPIDGRDGFFISAMERPR